MNKKNKQEKITRKNQINKTLYFILVKMDRIIFRAIVSDPKGAKSAVTPKMYLRGGYYTIILLEYQSMTL